MAKNKKIKIKITIKGPRACGKSVMAVLLHDFLASQGANVKLTGYDFDPRERRSKKLVDDNISHIRSIPKQFDKWAVEIHEPIVRYRTNKGADKGCKKAHEYLKIWGIK